MRKWIVVAMALVLINFGFINYVVVVDKVEAENQQGVIEVNDSTGGYVGTVTNLLVDSSGTIAFIILFTGQEEEEGKEIVIPFEICSYDHKNKLIVLNFSKEELAAAPVFDVSDLSDPTFAERVYRFFGVMPAWTE